MRIGELASLAGSDVDTIRYYEKIGILPKPARTESNYRQYNDQHADRLKFVRHCRSLDMTLDEIRVLLQFRDAPESNCGEVNRLLDEHIGHVISRIAALTELEQELRKLRGNAARFSRQRTAASSLGSVTVQRTQEAKPASGTLPAPTSQDRHLTRFYSRFRPVSRAGACVFHCRAFSRKQAAHQMALFTSWPDDQ